MSALKTFEPAAIESAARRALDTLAENPKYAALKTVSASTDIFELLDSFAIVELMLATEEQLEGLAGRYVPLGDESVLDASISPLRSFQTWLTFISAAVSRG